MITVFFQPYSFRVIDILPQNTTSTAAYFSEHVAQPFHQLYRSGTPDNRPRKLHLHFDNPRCRTAQFVIQQMEYLRCKRIPHPPYSPDLVICDFYLFARLKERLAGVEVNSPEELMEEVMTILRGISGPEKVRAFDQWIERCQWVANHNSEYYHPGEENDQLKVHESRKQEAVLKTSSAPDIIHHAERDNIKTTTFAPRYV
jgi:hypothetical protein